MEIFAKWSVANRPSMEGFGQGGYPKGLITAISEDLLERFRKAPLLNAYDIYQHLMDYWAQTMQDDCYLIAADGWIPRTDSHDQIANEGMKRHSKRNTSWPWELVPKAYIVGRYFAKEQGQLDAFQSELESVGTTITGLVEEHSGEEGAFGELEKINKGEVSKRLKEVRDDPDYNEERGVLEQWLLLDQRQSDLRGMVKKADADLDKLAREKYPQLSLEEMKMLVVDDKWLGTLSQALHQELERVSQSLTSRIRELAERYDTPLPELVDEVAQLSARVDEHLKRMGAKWN